MDGRLFINSSTRVLCLFVHLFDLFICEYFGWCYDICIPDREINDGLGSQCKSKLIKQASDQTARYDICISENIFLQCGWSCGPQMDHVQYEILRHITVVARVATVLCWLLALYFFSSHHHFRGKVVSLKFQWFLFLSIYHCTLMSDFINIPLPWSLVYYVDLSRELYGRDLVNDVWMNTYGGFIFFKGWE